MHDANATDVPVGVEMVGGRATGRPAPVPGVTGAVGQRELWDRPSLSFLDADRGRGALLHRRHDGHDGPTSPAA